MDSILMDPIKCSVRIKPTKFPINFFYWSFRTMWLLPIVFEILRQKPHKHILETINHFHAFWSTFSISMVCCRHIQNVTPNWTLKIFGGDKYWESLLSLLELPSVLSENLLVFFKSNHQNFLITAFEWYFNCVFPMQLIQWLGGFSVCFSSSCMIF